MRAPRISPALVELFEQRILAWQNGRQAYRSLISDWHRGLALPGVPTRDKGTRKPFPVSYSGLMSKTRTREQIIGPRRGRAYATA